MLVTETLDGWQQPQSSQHSGLLVKRAADGKWDEFQSDIDAAAKRFGRDESLKATVNNDQRGEAFSNELHECVQAILLEAKLPPPLSEQIREDACAIGEIVATLLSNYIGHNYIGP